MILTPAELAAIIGLAFCAGAWWSFPMAKRRAELKLERELDLLDEDLY